MTRQFRPALESIEPRQLLSVTAILATRHPLAHAGVVATGVTNDTSTGVNGPNGIVLGQGTSNQFTAPTGTPTGHEARRQAFVFTFTGEFRQGRGRYNDEASLTQIKAVGRSTYFLHGDLQLGAVVPTDPSRPTAGQATSFDKNLNSNSAFGFDLNGTTAELDKAGRPTRFSAVTDVNTSAGAFVESQSASTVTIKYLPDGKSHPKGTSAGKATVVIRGFAYTLGTANILGGTISQTGSDSPGKVNV